MEIIKNIKMAASYPKGAEVEGQVSKARLSKTQKTGYIEFEIGCNHYWATLVTEVVPVSWQNAIPMDKFVIYSTNLPEKWKVKLNSLFRRF